MNHFIFACTLISTGISPLLAFPAQLHDDLASAFNKYQIQNIIAQLAPQVDKCLMSKLNMLSSGFCFLEKDSLGLFHVMAEP